MSLVLGAWWRTCLLKQENCKTTLSENWPPIKCPELLDAGLHLEKEKDTLTLDDAQIPVFKRTL